MVFITAGMGGGTGTGAAPIIAQAARELGVLTVGVVTRPFQFEGGKRMRQANEGIEALQKVVDTLIIIPNQNLFRLANEKTTFTEAFAMADDVLYQGVKGVTDLMVRPGLINLDFADVRAVMDEMGKAMMGTGEASGENRAIQAAEKAIANPLLDEISLRGAKGVLINITGGADLTLFELDEAANRIREEVDPEANIIVGSTLDEGMDGVMRVSVVATGIDANQAMVDVPVARRPLSEPLPRHTTHVATQPAHAPAPQPVAHPAPQPVMQAPRAPEPQPVYREEMRAAPVAPAPQPAQEPSLFDNGYRPEPQAEAADDEMPAPAYRPQPVAQPAARDFHVEDEAGSFIAPRPRAPGTPSPEAMARLEAAVKRAPQSVAAAAVQQRMQPQPAPAAPQPHAAGERPRFGINSLINRMTGGQHPPAQAPAPAAQRAMPAARQQPRLSAEFDEEPAADPDKDRIEIPAFLRRQAN